MMPNKRGGARKGAGRKPPEAIKRRVNINIDDATAARYRAVGNGNLSDGIRRSVGLLTDEVILDLSLRKS